MKFIISILLLLAVIYSSEQIKDDIINRNRKSVVQLTNLIQTSGGTGFFVVTPSGRTRILTNGHVCKLAGPDGGLVATTETDVSVVYVEAVYENNDLCLLSAPDKAPGLKVARSLKNLEDIYIIGFPLLQPKTTTKGQISGSMNVGVMQGYDIPCEGPTYKKVSPVDAGDLGGFLAGHQYLCIRTTPANISTANILPGNSGSPVLNQWGHVVGAAFAGSIGSGRSFLVPLEDIQDFLRDK